MQYEAPLSLTMNHDMSGNGHYANQQNLYVPNGNSRIKSETGSDRGVSPHTSDQNSRYSSSGPSYAALAAQLSSGMRYPSPSSNLSQPPQIQQPNGVNLMTNPYSSNPPDQQYQQQTPMGAVQTPSQTDQSPMDTGRASAGGSGLPKAFACSTCAKGFARRSDLARHERIHSGVRPHVCEHPGCGKQFIQRSALTVHSRVHTGEKPHMCERCGKPFSDSSSLARHRRIHSGKRPYKCPYADCQKTFTRRTTLTRHQNHHTGTIEESQAATAAALASRHALQQHARNHRGSEDGDEYSTDSKSPMPPQQDNRANSVSPASALNGLPTMARQTTEYYMNAMNNSMAAVPQHMRGEMQPSPRSQSPAQYQIPVTAQQQRPGLTSNPSAGYSNPPQILEPPAANGQPQSASGSNSPHMGAAIGWQSPHNGLAAQGNDYAYADPNHGYANVNTTQMYYPQPQQQQQRGPNGTMEFAPMRGQEMWAQHQQ